MSCLALLQLPPTNLSVSVWGPYSVILGGLFGVSAKGCHSCYLSGHCGEQTWVLLAKPALSPSPLMFVCPQSLLSPLLPSLTFPSSPASPFSSSPLLPSPSLFFLLFSPPFSTLPLPRIFSLPSSPLHHLLLWSQMIWYLVKVGPAASLGGANWACVQGCDSVFPPPSPTPCAFSLKPRLPPT